MDDFIRLEEVRKIYQTGQVVTKAVDGINFTISEGEFVVIIGASGAGKTTILNILGGMDTVTSGSVFVDGNDIAKYSRRQLTQYRRNDIGFVFQFYNLVPNLTALENVMFGPIRVRKMSQAAAREQALALLERVGLGERAEHYPSELSGGQQQRVAIARALAVKPKMMLFDEPTSALDPELRHEVLKVMRSLADEGMTMIIVTHEIGFARDVASRLIFIDGGTIAEDGPPDILLNASSNPRLKEFLQHVS